MTLTVHPTSVRRDRLVYLTCGSTIIRETWRAGTLIGTTALRGDGTPAERLARYAAWLSREGIRHTISD